MTADDFLLAWLEHDGDPRAIVRACHITPSRLLELVREHRALLDGLEDLHARRARLHALDDQLAAAQGLRKAIPELRDPDRRRLAATALGRIAAQLLSATRGHAKPASPARAAPPKPLAAPATPVAAPPRPIPSPPPILSPERPRASVASRLRQAAGVVRPPALAG